MYLGFRALKYVRFIQPFAKLSYTPIRYFSVKEEKKDVSKKGFPKMENKTSKAAYNKEEPNVEINKFSL